MRISQKFLGLGIGWHCLVNITEKPLQYPPYSAMQLAEAARYSMLV